MSKTKPARDVLSVRLADDTHERFNAILRKYGGRGIKVEAVGRLIEFWIKQPESFQQIMVGWAASDIIGAYASALRQLADELEGDPHQNITIKGPIKTKNASV